MRARKKMTKNCLEKLVFVFLFSSEIISKFGPAGGLGTDNLLNMALFEIIGSTINHFGGADCHGQIFFLEPLR